MEHTSKLIIGSKSKILDGKKIALCVTGSVAAVESVALARALMRHGAEVYPIMSNSAQKIIHPYALEWATGNPVVTELTGQIEHVTLAGKHADHVDLVLVAPSTANTIGKVANGIDDTPVTTTLSSAIGAGIPVIIVPAMHKSMYEHPAVLDNLQKLQQLNVRIINPRMEEAKAKIPDVNTIVDYVLATLGPNDLVGKHFVVTAGPTRGWIDRVRFITNPSSGKMGIAITKEILLRGGTVTLILGPTCLTPPTLAETVHVETSKEMLDAVIAALDRVRVDALISAAAILDFTPAQTEDRKRPSGEKYSIELVPTEKVIDAARHHQKDLFIVGFKVESGVTDEELVERARKKIDAKICNLVIGNDAQRSGVAFGTDTNEVLIVGEKGLIEKIPLAPKSEIARRVVNTIVERLKEHQH
ncbi:MAG: bifunctional phosphopantothenoylcysteine decarboxylase/phosphopantothenate--cysteine ligase CoaBC [Candidatus Thorarchaeota archaeon]|nr:bifunctional phosphopantothenoylcysteine decarboxylase/phosphopantothenate--cysteine ligase CoaBC [Candidatus Thorarchaeota archaeon]